MKPVVVISPYNVANFPEGGGHFWVYMQYAQGLRQLGCEVYWMENFRSSGELEQDALALAAFQAKMDRFGFAGKLILYLTSGKSPQEGPSEYIGMTQAEAEAIFERADLLLNFHYAIAPALLARFRRTAMVDIDPGLLQFWISRRQLSVARHDYYFTTGETVGTPTARFPDCGLDWIHVPPAVCLERWPYTFDARAKAFTTVSSWDGGDWIVDGKEVYENTKRMSFLQFADLPRQTEQTIELALFLRTEQDAADRRLMESHGWRIRASRELTKTPELYQSYIQASRGEFSCAKPSCLKFQNAWVSDRTLCYLASGKPVVVQHTGPSSFLPDHKGMFRFSTMKEAADALAAVNADYEGNCRAARQIAELYFDAKKVLGKILSCALKPAGARVASSMSPTLSVHS